MDVGDHTAGIAFTYCVMFVNVLSTNHVTLRIIAILAVDVGICSANVLDSGAGFVVGMLGQHTNQITGSPVTEFTVDMFFCFTNVNHIRLRGRLGGFLRGIFRNFRQTCITMDMLFQGADQSALRVKTGFIVGVFFRFTNVNDIGLRDRLGGFFYGISGSFLQTCILMDMHGNITVQYPVDAIAIFIVGVSGKATAIQFLIFGKFTVTMKYGTIQIIIDILNAISGIAFQSLELGRFMFCFRNDFHNKTYMLRSAVAMPIEEDKIAGFGHIILGSMKQPFLRQSLDPGTDAAIKGHIFHFCIVQAEGNKHGTPVTVGVTVPVTVAGVSV
jgi:hypothetical protein